jgi:hypothetical protein
MERKTWLRPGGEKFVDLFPLKIFKEWKRPAHEIENGICITSSTSLLCPLRHFLSHCLHIFPRERLKEERKLLRRLLHIFLKQFFSSHHFLPLWLLPFYLNVFFRLMHALGPQSSKHNILNVTLALGAQSVYSILRLI